MKKVYIPTGKVVHFLNEGAPLLPDVVPERAPAVCNTRPLWPGQWFDVEDYPTELPTCRNCLLAAGETTFAPLFGTGASADAGTA